MACRNPLGIWLFHLGVWLLGTPCAPGIVDREGYDGNLDPHGELSWQAPLVQRDQTTPLERGECRRGMTLVVTGCDALEGLDLSPRTPFRDRRMLSFRMHDSCS